MGQQRASDRTLTAQLRIFLTLFVLFLVPFALLACKRETSPPSSAPAVPTAPRVAAAPPSTSAAPQPAEKTAPPKAPIYSYDPQGRPDPFLPLVLPHEREREEGKKGLKGLVVSELKLTGIVWDKTEYVALVEARDRLGYVLKINDVIGGSARVARISPNSVIFEVKERPYLPNSGFKEVELKLKKEE